MTTIDEFITKTRDTPYLGEAKVVKKFNDAQGFNLSDKIIITIPDMHLLTRGNDDNFFDGKSPYEKRFMGFINFLCNFKKEQGENLEIIHMGDFYDLWRGSNNNINTNKIEETYHNIIGEMNDDLKSVYIVGNHDIELWNYKKNEGRLRRKFRHFSHAGPNESTIMFEHGFQADCVNNPTELGVVGKEITKIVDWMEIYVESDIDIKLEGCWSTFKGLFSRFNNVRSSHDYSAKSDTHEYMDYYTDFINTNRQKVATPRLVCCVIGHTHNARLISKSINGMTIYLMDCGCWVNGHNDFGIIIDKELAICQWDSPDQMGIA